MRLYFSGVSSPEERDMLIAAGVRDYLCDPFDYPNLPGPELRDTFALDSGAYRAFKAGIALEVLPWLEAQDAWWQTHPDDEPDFVIMPDVLGDWQATWERWQVLKRVDSNCAPVWQWGAPRGHLEELVADERNETVCLGGLVPAMRANDERVLAELVPICREYGSKLHFLGLNWLKAMGALMPFLKSADTSKWLDGARYGSVFVMAEDGCLAASHKTAAFQGGASRELLCAGCARMLKDWTEGKLAAPEGQKARRMYVLKDPGMYKATPGQLAANAWFDQISAVENEKRHRQAVDRLSLERRS